MLGRSNSIAPSLEAVNSLGDINRPSLLSEKGKGFRIFARLIAICRSKSMVVDAEKAVGRAYVLAQTVKAFKKFEVGDTLCAVRTVIGGDTKIGEPSGE